MWYSSLEEIKETINKMDGEGRKKKIYDRQKGTCVGCEEVKATELYPVTAKSKSKLFYEWFMLCPTCAVMHESKLKDELIVGDIEKQLIAKEVKRK